MCLVVKINFRKNKIILMTRFVRVYGTYECPWMVASHPRSSTVPRYIFKVIP